MVLIEVLYQNEVLLLIDWSSRLKETPKTFNFDKTHFLKYQIFEIFVIFEIH